MTDAQYAVVAEILKTRKPLFAHHGCCIGADAQFNELAQELHIMTVGHPPSDITSLAAALELDYRRPARRFLDRNMQIIKETGAVIAAPRSRIEQVRGSGTWYVIRRSRAFKKELFIVYPDGDIGQ
jgi:hypothetical protein